MRRSFLLAVALSLAAFGCCAWRFDFVCDDAFIAFRYSRNLAAGLGLRFNPGEEPPVEGYTQLGWVLFGALLERAGLDLPLGSRITTAAAGAVLLALVVRSAARRYGALPAAAAGVFLGTLPTFAVWATGGLETMVFALALFVCAERLLDDPERPRLLGALLAASLAALLRADGSWWLGAILLGAGIQGLRARQPALVRAVLICAGTLALLTAAHFVFRRVYHGDWVPNTARAKVGLSAMTLERGLLYLLNWWATVPGTLIAVLLGAWTALRGRSAAAGFALWMCGITCAYGVLVGGDFMCMGRFFLPATPFLALLVAQALHELAGGGRRALACALAALVVGASLPATFDRYLVPAAWRERTHFRWNSPRYSSEYVHWRTMRTNAEVWTLLGRALAAHTRAGESLVHATVGAVGYYSALTIHDQHGLVDREVAVHPPPAGRRRSPGHDRYVEPSFFASRNPTYLDAYLIDDGSRPRRNDLGGTVRIVPLGHGDGLPAGRALVLVENR